MPAQRIVETGAVPCAFLGGRFGLWQFWKVRLRVPETATTGRGFGRCRGGPVECVKAHNAHNATRASFDASYWCPVGCGEFAPREKFCGYARIGEGWRSPSLTLRVSGFGIQTATRPLLRSGGASRLWEPKGVRRRPAQWAFSGAASTTTEAQIRGWRSAV